MVIRDEISGTGLGVGRVSALILGFLTTTAVVVAASLGGVDAQPSTGGSPSTAGSPAPVTVKPAAQSTARVSATHHHVRPIHVKMPRFDPVAIVGSTLYRASGRVRLGIDDIATYVNTRGSLVVADTHGHIYSWRHGNVALIARFRPRFGLTLTTDATARYVAIVRMTGLYGHARLRVYDARTHRVVLNTTTRGHQPGTVSLDDKAVYYRANDKLIRVALATGTSSVVHLRYPSHYLGVIAERVITFHPFGGYLRPVRNLSHAARLPLADSVSPNLHYGVGLELGLAWDNTTRKRLPAVPIPHHRIQKISFYGWVGPGAASFERGSRQGKTSTIFSCAIGSATCVKAVARVPYAGRVGPGGWAPYGD